MEEASLQTTAHRGNMDYNLIYNTFLELKTTLEAKKHSIINKNLEELNSADDNIVALCEKIAKFDLQNNSNALSDEQKHKLKEIGAEIKVLEENNEILIKHSLDVINDTLSGILNIVDNEKTSYNAKGIGCQNSESLNISSITEEA